MAATSLLALLDDIASVLDDVALLTKVAAKKTAGVLGDDLALNAQQVSDIRADRELPVVWAVAKGSLVNKAFLVPAALALNALAPRAVMPLLMAGGAWLCYEGFEKVAHRIRHGRAGGGDPAVPDAEAARDPVAFERLRVRGAIRTDFVLSAEIVVITLGTVATSSFATQALVLAGVAVLMTAGVYGFVAGIVKLDDAGVALVWRPGTRPHDRWLRRLGDLLLAAAPVLMKTLAVVGTLAMFLVGGGILAHGVPGLAHGIEAAAEAASGWPVAGGLSAWALPVLLNGVVGLLAGALALAIATGIRKVFRRGK